MLHQLTNREGHTALLIGGLSVLGESLTRLDSATRARSGTFLIKATIVLTARSDDQNSDARLTPAAADQLGIGGITLLVIRPDGHVGLRADRNHIEALMAYHALLVSGRTFKLCLARNLISRRDRREISEEGGASEPAKLGVHQM
jgi:hypothetical protein